MKSATTTPRPVIRVPLGRSTLFRADTGTTLAQAFARAASAHAAHNATRGDRNA